MNSFLQPRKKSGPLFAGRMAWFAFLLVLILAVHFFVPSFFPRVFGSVAVPLWRGWNAASNTLLDAAQLLSSKRSLVDRNRELTARLDELSVHLLQMPLLVEENSELKALVGRVGTEDVVRAAVLTRPPASPYDSMVVDAGFAEGVSVGNQVRVFDVPIGVVERVDAHISRILLYSAPGVVISAFLPAHNLPVEAKGQGGGNFIAAVVREEHVERGDIITVPGISTSLLAIVESVSAAPAGPFQTIRFKIPVNLSEVQFVEIVRGSTTSVPRSNP